MAEPIHSLDRGLGALTIELARNFSRQRQQFAELGFQEVWQQYQLDISGTDAKVGHVDVTFDSPFSYAPTRRNNDVQYPHASFAIYCPLADLDTGDPLTPSDFLPPKVWATVTHYYRDPDSDTFTGARIFVEVEQIGTDPANPVAISLHATFQGYAAWNEDESDL